MRKIVFAVLLFHAILISACKKSDDPPSLPATDYSVKRWDGVANQDDNKGTNINPIIWLYFPAAIDRATVASAIVLHTANYTSSYENGDSVLVIQPTSLSYLSKYKLTVGNSLKSSTGGKLLFPNVLGDKLWGQYGFKDAFSLNTSWFADSYLAIDQGPIVVMIENYRSGLLWDLFTSCPEVKSGLVTLGFSAPYL